MTNITIEVIMATFDNQIVDLENKYELTESEGSLLLDIVRDRRIIVKSDSLIIRKDLARPKEQEMFDICELFNHNIKYNPNKLITWKKRLFIPATKPKVKYIH